MNSIDRRLARLKGKLGPIGEYISLMAETPGTVETVEIYFLECGEWIKIGRSTNGNKRITDICNTIPYPVTWLGSFTGIPQDERDLHARFRRLRHKGEWFRKAPELVELIKHLCGREHDQNGNVGKAQIAATHQENSLAFSE